MPLNSFGTGSERRAAAIASVAPQVLFCDGERLQRLEPELAALGCHVVVAGAPNDESRGLLGFDAVSVARRTARQPVTVQPDEPCAAVHLGRVGATQRPLRSSHHAVCQAIFSIDFIGCPCPGMTPRACGGWPR